MRGQPTTVASNSPGHDVRLAAQGTILVACPRNWIMVSPDNHWSSTRWLGQEDRVDDLLAPDGASPVLNVSQMPAGIALT
jgi:hypothetical protein